MRALSLVLLVSGCTLSVDFEGKRCADVEPRCLSGYSCVDGLCVSAGGLDGGGSAGGGTGGGNTGGGNTGGGSTGGGAATCPLDVDPAAKTVCTGRTFYLSPTGSDGGDGLSPATARRDLNGLSFADGDEVYLMGGTWTQVPSLSTLPAGGTGCPRVVRGETDGGTVLKGTLRLYTTDLVVRDLTLAAVNANGLVINGADRLTLQRVTFDVVSASGNDIDLLVQGASTDVVIRECTWRGGNGTEEHTALQSDQPTLRLAFRGNHITPRRGGGFWFSGDDVVVEGNDFIGGTFNSNDAYVYFNPGSHRGVVRRNVFKDLDDEFHDKLLIGGAERVSHNTFRNLTNVDLAPLVENCRRVDDNLVSGVSWAFHLDGGVPPDGDYNTFENVSLPYSGYDGGNLGTTDKVAPLPFENDSMPAATSQAVDTGDPTGPVPPGGGPTVDRGARERGATRLGDGRYCFTDGGA